MKPRFPHEQYFDIIDGTVIVASDMHWWPDQRRSTAHAALLRLTEEFQPDLLIANGDVVDGARINRHAPIGWESKPKFVEEIEVSRKFLNEWSDLVRPETPRVWNLGNHDANFENRIAHELASMEGIEGMHLKDHFPGWRPAWTTCVNPDTDPCVITHREKRRSGPTALINNVKDAGCHMITSHTHAGNVWMHTNYIGTFFGVDTGTLMALYGPQVINYTEGGVENWRSSFAVLTFAGGRLLPPELCVVVDEQERLTAFRGELVQEIEG